VLYCTDNASAIRYKLLSISRSVLHKVYNIRWILLQGFPSLVVGCAMPWHYVRRASLGERTSDQERGRKTRRQDARPDGRTQDQTARQDQTSDKTRRAQDQTSDKTRRATRPDERQDQTSDKLNKGRARRGTSRREPES